MSPQCPTFCCTAHSLPISSPHSNLLTTFLLGLGALFNKSRKEQEKSNSSNTSTRSAPSYYRPLKKPTPAFTLIEAPPRPVLSFSSYLASKPLPDTIIELEITQGIKKLDRNFKIHYFGLLPGRPYFDREMFPDESFGIINHSRVERVLQKKENWMRKDCLRDGKNRTGWSCKECGWGYLIRVIEVEEEEEDEGMVEFNKEKKVKLKTVREDWENDSWVEGTEEARRSLIVQKAVDRK